MKTRTFLDRDTTPPTAKELDDAHYAPLDGVAASEAAKTLCAQLCTAAFHRSGKPNKKRQAAFAATVCDLLRVARRGPGTWAYRPLGAGTFSGLRVGFRPFTETLRAMQGMMVETYGGTRQYVQSEFTGGKRQVAWDRATRFRATRWLLSTLAEHGIRPDNWQEHFTVQPEANPPKVTLLVRTKAKVRQGGLVHDGDEIPFDGKDPIQKAMSDRMEALRDFYAAHDIQPYGRVILRRKFQNGDDPDFAWDCGGRLSAIGSENYQVQKPSARRTITIDGEPTVEMDIRASHLTILAGLGRISFDPAKEDPYLIEGLPRKWVKQWVTMTLSSSKRKVRWPEEAKAEYAKDHATPLQKDLPIKPFGDKVLAHLPILEADGKTPKAHWGQLQFLEAEAMIQTIETLAFRHQVPALPIHDSIIVPRSKRELSKGVLEEQFLKVTGAKPYVEEK